MHIINSVPSSLPSASCILTAIILALIQCSFTMSAIFSSMTLHSSHGESRVFLALEDGVAPFTLKRPDVDLEPNFAPPTYSYGFNLDDDDDDEDDEPPKLTAKLRIAAGAIGRLSHALRRPLTKPSRQAESVVFTNPDNWRPGLVTLEQAATRVDIVRRPESFERF